MTIASQTSRISYVGDGVTTSFPIPFFFQVNADITVMLQNSAGVQTTLALGTGYTLTGAGVSSGGTATITPAPTALNGAVITIFRDPPVTQTTSYNNNDPFPAKSHENALDKLTALAQRTRDMISRTLQLRDSDAAVDMHLPANRQGKLLGFDSSNNPVAVFGPTFVGSTDIGAAIVSTKAVAQVTTFASTVLYLVIGGTSVAGDTTQATYIRGTGTGAFTDGGGVSWKPVPSPGNIITAFPVAVIGDGTTDDRAAMQATIDALSAIGGGTLYGSPGKTYRVVINSSVTDFGLIMKPNVKLLMNRCTINLECTGGVYGIRMQSDSHIEGPGVINTSVSTTPGSTQSLVHAPISIGAQYGEVTSVSAVGPYINATRWSIRRVKVSTVRAGGCHIAGMGGISHGVIEDIEYPDNAVAFGCVNFDWGTVGNISSGAIPASRILYDAGQAYTLHPNNIYVSRLKIGLMTATGSTPLRISGCHDIRFDGADIALCNGAAAFVTAGDIGYEFAQDNNIRRRAQRGNVFRNIDVQAANLGNAIHMDAFSDNLDIAIGAGYSPLTASISAVDIVFENVRAMGAFSGVSDGIDVNRTIGGTFRNCFMIGFARGAVFRESAQRCFVQGGEFSSSSGDGIYIGNATLPPSEIRIDGAWCYSNGSAGTFSGVKADYGTKHTITRCRFGIGAESFQSFGVSVSANCVDVDVSNNHTEAIKSGGAGYSIGTVTSFVCRLYVNNTVSAGVNPFSGQAFIPVEYVYHATGLVRRFRAQRGSLSAGATPSSGSWLLGDTIEIDDPISGNFKGTVCTVAGTPGTWKTYGVIS